MYDHILVPCDGSPEAERAAGHAIELAENVGAALHALFVDTSAVSALGRPRDRETGEQLTESGKRALENVRERCEERGVTVETLVAEGNPAEVIVDSVGPKGIDLVVMGTHGRSGVERILIGSVTEQVVRTSPVPVTTVGPKDDCQAVRSAERARRIAHQQLEVAGHGDATVEAPSRQRNAWVVHARDGDEEFNVYINSGTGRSKLVRLD